MWQATNSLKMLAKVNKIFSSHVCNIIRTTFHMYPHSTTYKQSMRTLHENSSMCNKDLKNFSLFVQKKRTNSFSAIYIRDVKVITTCLYTKEQNSTFLVEQAIVAFGSSMYLKMTRIKNISNTCPSISSSSYIVLFL